MTIQGQLLAMLETVAEALGDDMLRQMVFVGGCSTAVLITDEITLHDVRATDDVDVIVNLAGQVQWYQLQEKLRKKGFTISSEDKVICRMRLGDLKVDFMPDDETILGFSNRWYKQGIRTSIPYALPSGREIRHLTSPLFLATKFEAFLDRGGNDPLSSPDLEDIMLLIDGREELLEEMQRAQKDVRQFIAEQLRALLEHPDFDHFLFGNIKGPDGRTEVILGRIDAMIQGVEPSD